MKRKFNVLIWCFLLVACQCKAQLGDAKEPIIGYEVSVDVYSADSIVINQYKGDSLVEGINITYKSKSGFVPNIILRYPNVESIVIFGDFRGFGEMLLDSNHIFWSFPKLKYVRYGGRIYEKGIIYYPPFSDFNSLQQMLSQGKVDKIYTSVGVLSDSCLLNLKGLTGLGLCIGDGHIPLPKCLASMTNLRYLAVYGDNNVNHKIMPKLDFDILSMSFLDTLNFQFGYKFRVKDVHLDSIKYLGLGESEHYNYIFAKRLQRKYPHAFIDLIAGYNVKSRRFRDYQRSNVFTNIWRGEYESEWEYRKHREEIINYKKSGWDWVWPLQITADYAYVPWRSSKFTMGLQYYFWRLLDKRGTTYTGGAHVLNLNMGAYYVREHPKTLVIQGRYDYHLPCFPIFFGLGLDAYKPAGSKQFIPYIRPRIGSAPIPVLSFWTSYGIPLSKQTVPYLPLFEIGVTAALKPILFKLLSEATWSLGISG